MSKQSPVLYTALRPIAAALFRLVFLPKFEGIENIPKTGAVIIAGNHRRSVDCFMLFSATSRCIHFLAKAEIFKGPFKYFFSGAGLIPVHRQTKDRAALDAAIDYLNMGCAVGLFPEGKVNHTDEIILPLKFGAIKMAHDTGAPIIPFTITGKYLPFARPRIVYHEPFYVSGDDLPKENERLREHIGRLLAEQRAQK